VDQVTLCLELFLSVWGHRPISQSIYPSSSIQQRLRVPAQAARPYQVVAAYVLLLLQSERSLMTSVI